MSQDLDLHRACLTAWGEGAEAVSPRLRGPVGSTDTYAIVLLKPGDWPIRPVTMRETFRGAENKRFPG